MDQIIEYATYTIDITHALLDYPQGLSEQQLDFVKIIERRAVEFITDFMQMQSTPIQELRRYLNHDALSPVTVIIGYAEFALMADQDEMHPDYRDAFQQICECGYALQDEIKNFHQQVWEFMESMDIPR